MPRGGRALAAIHAWLLVLPAAALLAAFTHYPILATLRDSLLSNPRGARVAVFVGLENYRFMAADPVFWQVMGNNAVNVRLSHGGDSSSSSWADKAPPRL